MNDNKICPKCGAEIPSNSSFCSKCGESFDSELFSYENDAAKEKKRKSPVLTIVVAIILLAIGSAAIFMLQQTTSLKKELMRDWSRVDESEYTTYVKCVLDFSEDEIEYYIQMPLSSNATITTYKYKVAGNKLLVMRSGDQWETFDVEFNEDKSMMTVTPALTSADNSEFWYNFD